jgi:hypothetical protein
MMFGGKVSKFLNSGDSQIDLRYGGKEVLTWQRRKKR